jgi:hypothetical protein
MIAVLGALADVERDLIRTRTASRAKPGEGAGATHGQGRQNSTPQNRLKHGGERKGRRSRSWRRATTSRVATISRVDLERPAFPKDLNFEIDRPRPHNGGIWKGGIFRFGAMVSEHCRGSRGSDYLVAASARAVTSGSRAITRR